MKIYYWDDPDPEDVVDYSVNDIAEEGDFYVGSDGGWYRRTQDVRGGALYWRRLQSEESREARKNFEYDAEILVRRSLGLS